MQGVEFLCLRPESRVMAVPVGNIIVGSAQLLVAQLTAFMRLYEVVFHPLWFAAMTGLVLVVYEWSRNSGDRSELGVRLGVLLGVLAVGSLPALGYVLLSPVAIGVAFTNPPWQVDVASAVGVVVTAAGLWFVWRHYDWGKLVPGGALVLVATLVPYAAIAPFWDISGHVTFTTALSLYLALVDRRFAPVVLVALVMIVNRPYLGAHTWLQSIAGFVLAVVVVAGVVTFVLDDGIGPTTSRRSSGSGG